jgi:hypothetical protein
MSKSTNNGGGRRKDSVWNQVEEKKDEKGKKFYCCKKCGDRVSGQPCRVKTHLEKCVKSKSFKEQEDEEEIEVELAALEAAGDPSDNSQKTFPKKRKMSLDGSVIVTSKYQKEVSFSMKINYF